MSWEVEVIGDCRLCCGDAYSLLSEIEADALVTDPPYGIAFPFDAVTKPSLRRSSAMPHERRFYSVGKAWTQNVVGDDRPFDPQPFLHFRTVILWGAQHYSTLLPSSAAWLIWDKREGTACDHHGDCEMAWTNLPGPSRLHRQLWRGAIRAGEENVSRDGKCHPAQKPLALMRWCVEKTTGVVFDPFAGSFTTGVACVQLRRPFIGVEIERQYFDLGCRRIEEAYRQGDLFRSVPQTIAYQEALL